MKGETFYKSQRSREKKRKANGKIQILKCSFCSVFVYITTPRRHRTFVYWRRQARGQACCSSTMMMGMMMMMVMMVLSIASVKAEYR